MTTTVIDNVTLVTPDELVPQRAVRVREGTIQEVGPCGGVAGERVLDGNGMYLAPGFIDLHIHGLLRWGIDNGRADLAAICGSLPQYGVTGFLPTISPRVPGEDSAFLTDLARVKPDGAAILGFHLEGPFLTQTGALPPEALGRADPQRVRSLIEAANPYPAIFSIAPEFEGVEDLIPIMREHAPVFMSHTRAGVKDAGKAIEAGARHATHFYDVWPPPPESDPGVRPCGAVEAVLADPRVTVDFILDGEHVDPVAIELALRCKGEEGVCLITDANVGAGLPPGRYTGIGKRDVVFAYRGGPARIADGSDQEGTLAGSGLTLDLAVKNATEMLDLDVCAAVVMASTNPAAVLGLEARKGRIERGCDADMVLLDSDLNVRRTWVGGECVYDGGKSARHGG